MPSRADLARAPHPALLVATVARLALVFLVIRAFCLQNDAFLDVFVLASAGFVVHAVLPLRWRLGFFTLLSFAALFMTVGSTRVEQGLWVVGLGLTLIVLCRLPALGACGSRRS